MLSKYFEDMQKSMAKKTSAKKTTGTKKTSSKKATAKISESKIDKSIIIEKFSGIIPGNLVIEEAIPIDANGFAPDGADLVIFSNYCRDLVSIMGGYVPLELIYATCYIVPKLDKKSLIDVLNRVASVKKINKYAETGDNDDIRIPAFIIAGESDYPIMDIKNDLLNYYNNKNIDPDCEFELLMIMNKGIVIKNWRERRSFIGLETVEDTMMWYFILMNEYLDIKREIEIDFRNYVKIEKTYTQY